jgi:hypothetical protein
MFECVKRTNASPRSRHFRADSHIIFTHSFLCLCGHSRNGSLLNTARLMDDNPTLLRLKELETLEKVTEKVDKLTVFGGLEGVLKDVVRIHAPAN